MFPRLAMIFQASSFFADMTVFRPVKTHTVFGVIARTPIHTVPRETYGPRNLFRRPSKTPARHVFRIVDRLNDIYCKSSGSLVAASAVNTKPKIDNVVGYNRFAIGTTEASVGTECRIETILEVLKIGGLKIAQSHKQVWDGWNKQSYGGVALSLNNEEVQAFVNCVRLASIPSVGLHMLISETLV
jgi:hypothetical protein